MKKILTILMIICYSCTLFSQSGIDEQKIDNCIVAKGEISIYPNSATNVITVTNEGVNSVYIYDLAGCLVASSESNVVNVANLKGIYVVKANTEAGVITGQLLIKKNGFSKTKTVKELQEELNCLIILDEYNEYKALLVENDCRVDVDIFDHYDDDNCEYLYKYNRIPEKYFLIELDTTIWAFPAGFSGIRVQIVKNIKLKNGRYFYTTTDTARISVNDGYVDIPFRFEYDINKFARGKFGYEIKLRTYKNNKFMRTSYIHNIRASEKSKGGITLLW